MSSSSSSSSHPLSTSKQAVRLMNITGVCAHPIHFHSFSAVGGEGRWILRSPRSLFIATFEKCAGCQGRLGANAVATTDDCSARSSFDSVSTSSDIVQCVACGVYAHRTCAFSQRSIPSSSGGPRSLLSPCEINLPLVKKALGDDETVDNDGTANNQHLLDTSTSNCDDDSHDNDVKIAPGNSSTENDGTIINNQVTANCNVDSEDEGDPAQEDTKEETLSSNCLSSNCLKERIVPEEEEEAEKKTEPTALSIFQTSVEIVKKTSETSKRIPKASAVGMVAGGVAGLAIAGPAGMVVGSQIGRTALVVGAAIEGSVGIGVLVMSLAAAANFSLNSKKDQRELKLLEQGSKTLVLVRPEIECDPKWVDYADEARQSWERMSKESSSASKGGNMGSFFLMSNDKQTSPDFRYSKDADIIKADSTELAIREKVFLLVNRILNDKMSLPGYVYRHLILKHKRMIMFNENIVSEQSQSDDVGNVDVSRICRTNAHNIIKHVTATLLEVRPGLASSSVMTELSADAVELLVFGELYDDIFDEIVKQTKEQDLNLSDKAKDLNDHIKLDNNGNDSGVEEPSAISQSAIASLRALPQAHTPSDKLHHCVVFLESISEHFSTLYKGKCIDADTLLVMVCQHVVTSDVSHLYAEVAFLDEFSRDEQLLSGKEGYALISLQASLHYLASLDEFVSVLGPIRS
jgi:hypothetical protein